MKRSTTMLASALAVAVAVPGIARAEYPEKPIEMTILFGSTAKTIGQLLANEMSKSLGQTVVPVDRPGGAGAVGYNHVKGTPADGYSIVWNSNSISTSYHRGNMKLTYKDFTPIAKISEEPVAIAVKSDKGWKSLAEMAKAAKASGSKLKVGTSGVGSFTHVVGASVCKELKIDCLYVPYDGGKAPTELLGGRIDVAVQWPGQFVSHMKAGTINMIAVTSSERVGQVPDVKTAKEQGVPVELTMWRGLAAPSGTPAPVIKKLEAAAQKAANSPEFKAALTKLGAEVTYLPADKFSKLIVTDDKRLADIMAGIGLKKTK